MSYGFPFTKENKVIELGGGNKPYFRPNLDVRAGENIDIVADFNQPLPLPDEEYDGVVSVFCIEHLSWRKVRLFLEECFRILKVGGRVVYITANTEKQMEHVLAKEEWDDDSSCIIFGDQDYPENTHRNSLNPKYAIKLLSDAGFTNIMVLPFGNLHTDMVIEAKKMQSLPKFDRAYFDNPMYYGNPADGFYRDHPKNWIIFNKILEKNPQSVFEIGCGRGYLLKRLESKGIRCKGYDISKHCNLMRVTDAVNEFDITKTPWPINDKEYDLCISDGTLDFIPEQHKENVLKEIERISNRGIHRTYKQLKLENHEFVKQEQFESGSLSFNVPSGDEKIKLNIGSFTVMFHHGWVNTDVIDLSQYAAANQYKFICLDSTRPFPFNDNSVDFIYSSHMLEHLTYEEGNNFLKECYRMMKHGAVMRIAVPDMEKITRMYLNMELERLDEMNITAAQKPYQSHKFWSFLVDNHLFGYDYESMYANGTNAGFIVEKKNFNEGNETIIRETMDFMAEISLYVELTKPHLST